MSSSRSIVGVVVPRPTPAKATLSPLAKRLRAQSAEIAMRSPAKGRALEAWNLEVLKGLDEDDARKARKRA